MLEQELTQKQEIAEYHKLEIEEIFTATRAFTNLRTQILTFSGTANLTAMGLAFGTQKAGLLLLAAGIPALVVIADSFIRRHQGALYCRGLQLEKKYSPEGEPALLNTYIAVAAGRRALANLQAVAILTDQEARVEALRHARSSIFGFWVQIAIGLVESIAGIVLWLIARWSLF